MLKKLNNKGFTLLEGIIALTVITVGLMVGLTLAISNLLATQDNERRIIAANLAREGIEVVRNIRDNNWDHIEANDTYAGGTYYTFDTFLDETDVDVGNHFLVKIDNTTDPDRYVLVDTPSNSITSMDDCVLGNECLVNYNGATGEYGLTVGDSSIYHRLVTLQDICFNDSNNSETEKAIDANCSGLPGEEKIGVLVTSHVRYITNRDHDIIVKERLYDWR